MRISDWSSDVCSSDLAEAEGAAGAMTKTWIRVADQPLAAWAGLWRPTDDWGDCYTGVMVDATAELFDIHDRMPVILRPDEQDAWLHDPAEELGKAECRERGGKTRQITGVGRALK